MRRTRPHFTRSAGPAMRLGDPRALQTMRSSGADRRAVQARRSCCTGATQRRPAHGVSREPRRAIREIERPKPIWVGSTAREARSSASPIYHLADRTAEALPASERALHTLRRHGDKAWEARLSFNRGVVLAEIGDHHAARAELERARDLYSSLGYDTAAAEARIELGAAAVARAATRSSRSSSSKRSTPRRCRTSACWLNLNRAEALLATPASSRSTRRPRAIRGDLVARSGLRDNKSRLDAARLALAAGDPTRRRRSRRAARRSFAARRQPAFAAAARLVAARGDIARGSVTPSAIRAGRTASEELARRGRAFDALRGQLVVARAAAVSRSTSILRRELPLCDPLERRGTVADRVELRHVQALLLLREGDAGRAERRLRAGLDLLEELSGGPRRARGPCDDRRAGCRPGARGARDRTRPPVTRCASSRGRSDSAQVRSASRPSGRRPMHSSGPHRPSSEPSLAGFATRKVADDPPRARGPPGGARGDRPQSLPSRDGQTARLAR